MEYRFRPQNEDPTLSYCDVPIIIISMRRERERAMEGKLNNSYITQPLPIHQTHCQTKCIWCYCYPSAPQLATIILGTTRNLNLRKFPNMEKLLDSHILQKKYQWSKWEISDLKMPQGPSFVAYFSIAAKYKRRNTSEKHQCSFNLDLLVERNILL